MVYFEALDPEWTLDELAASEAPLETYYSGVMGKRLELGCGAATAGSERQAPFCLA